MWRATLKAILAHKLRLALTALAIVLGVGFVSGTYLLTDTMNRAFNDLFHRINAGVAVQVSGVPKFTASGPGGENAGVAERVPGSLIPAIRAVPGVKAAEGSIAGYAQLVTPKGKAVTTGGAPTLGVSASREPSLSTATTRAGRRPDRAGEISVDAGTATKYGLEVGDRVTVLLQGPSVNATIVGIFGFGSTDSLGGASVVAFDPATAQRVLNGKGAWDTIDVAAKPGVDPGALARTIQRTLPRGFEAKTGEQAAEDQAGQLKDALSFFNIALLVFAAISLFVGSFIIFNTFSILIAQRTRELALLRALGATAAQVRRSVLTEAVVVGAVGSAAGLAFGFVIAIGLQGLLRAFGIELPTTGLQLLPRTVIAAVAVGLLTTVAASLMPARRAARVPPIAALRESHEEAAGTSRRRSVAGVAVTVAGAALLAAGLFGSSGITFVGLGAALVFLGVAVLSPLFARPVGLVLGAPLLRLGMAGKLGRQNAIRNPRRTASTAAALMIGLGLVAFVSIFAASIKASTTDALARTLRADYLVSSTSQFSGFSQDVASRLRDSGAFSAVEQLRFGVFGIEGRTEQLFGLDPATLTDVTDMEMVAGSVEGLGDGEVLVAQTMAEDHGWRVGQAIPVEFARTGRRELRLAGIYTDNQLLNNFPLVTLGTFERNFTEQLDFLVLAKTAPGVAASRVASTVAAVKKAFPNVKLEDQTEFRDSQARQVDQLLGLVSALLGLAIVIALFGIVNTLALSIFERTREIGLLRAVGMARRQVRAMIRWEAVLIAVFGALLGTVVGAFFGWALVRALRDQGVTTLAFPAGQLLVYVVVAGLFGVVAAVLPARRAANLDVLAAVTTE